MYVCSRGAERWFGCCSVTNREEEKKKKTRADEPVRRGQEGGRGERGRERDLRPVKVEERRGENKMKKKRTDRRMKHCVCVEHEDRTEI